MRLSIRDLVKEYDKKEIFAHAGYSFEEGRIYGILGEPGCGKSTLFDCIGDEVAYKGTIELEKDGDILPTGIETVGISFQQPMVPEFLTGYEYVRFFLDTHTDKQSSTYTVEEYLKLVNIPQQAWGNMIKDYSADYKNRLQLIGIFISNCPVVLLDEPMQDTPKTEWEHMRALLDAFKADRIILIATARPELCEAFCEETVLLENGHFSTPSYDIEEMTLKENPKEEA